MIRLRALHRMRSPRVVIVLLAASLGLMMTGYGIIVPVFGKRLEEIGGGVQTLGFMTMAFALTQLALAPFVGALADRYGRRPPILAALGGFILANIAFLFAQTPTHFILIRGFEGAITAGLMPAAMGIVADTFEEKQRGRWTGILMGSYSAGFIFGPAFGGVLYDQFGFRAPFEISAALGVIGLIFAATLVPETRRSTPRVNELASTATAQRSNLLGSLPRPLLIFGTLLLLDFVAVFVFAFIEPQMVFFFYNQLGYTTTQFGLVIGFYGLAMVLGQTVLGTLSDKFGRRPMIVVGFALNTLFYLGLAMALSQFVLVLGVAFIAGLGASLMTPALSAAYLDITAEAHRSRVMGMKESAAALGGVVGPLLIALFSTQLTPQTVFLVAAVIAFSAGGFALLILKPSAIVSLAKTIENSNALAPVPVRSEE